MAFQDIVNKLRKHYYRILSEQKAIPRGLVRSQPVIINGKGHIKVMGTSYIGYNPSPGFYDGVGYLEARYEDAEICIGDNVYINNCFSAIAEHGRIIIGDNCLIGCNVQILNSDFHRVSIEHRNDGTQRSRDIIIGKNVWIGNDVTILKGVEIGDCSVISNGIKLNVSVPPRTAVLSDGHMVFKEIVD